MVGQITGKMFDHPIEKDCVSDLSDPGSCRIGPVRQVAGPENAAIQNLAALHWSHLNIQTTKPTPSSYFSGNQFLAFAAKINLIVL